MKNTYINKSVVIGIIFLFIGLMSISSYAQKIDKSARQTFDGNWLYVGGNGLGNYSIIQDAINNAADGDTIFVYHDSSPYYENIILNRSVQLVGEDKNTTVIDGNESDGHVVQILADSMSLSGFTIQNSGGIPNAACIIISSDNNIIYGNCVSCIPHHGEAGIWLNQASGNLVVDNIIANHHYGIWLEDSMDNTILNNSIINMWSWAVILGDAHGNMICGNNITQNSGGIYLRDSNENMIFENDICDNYRGIVLTDQQATSSQNTVSRNTFENNRQIDASFLAAQNFPGKNVWDDNYWNRARSLPKLIVGTKKVFLIPGAPFHFPGFWISIPWVNVDWHPALEPVIH